MTTVTPPNPPKPARETVAVGIGLAMVAIAKWLERVARHVAGTAGRDAADRIAAAEASAHVPRYRVYTAASLEESMRAFEERYGLASTEFIRLYDQDAVPPEISRHSANAWAMVCQEAERLRTTRSSNESFLEGVALPD